MENGKLFRTTLTFIKNCKYHYHTIFITVKGLNLGESIITLMMASAQVVETSVNTNNSPSQNYTTNPDDH